MTGHMIWISVVGASYGFIIFGSILMIAFATKFPFSTRIKDLAEDSGAQKRKFLGMNGWTVWLLAWLLIIVGTFIQLLHFIFG